jgi:hypothetical protein
VTFLPNKDFPQEFADDPETRKGLAEAAEPARQMAETLAKSIMPRQGVSRQIEVVETSEGIFIVNRHHGGHLDEFGSSKNPAYAPLRRGVEAAGLKFTESPKT